MYNHINAAAAVSFEKTTVGTSEPKKAKKPAEKLKKGPFVSLIIHEIKCFGGIRLCFFFS